MSRMVRVFCAAVLLALLSAAAAAAGYEVFINNKPFRGKVLGPPGDLLLEARPLFEMVGGRFEFDSGSGEARLNGVTLPVTLQDGQAFMSARELVVRMNGRYNVNKDLGTVDIYAFDPVASALKALQRIFALPSVSTESDFSTIVLVVRDKLERDMGLTLDSEVEMVLATPDDMAAAGGPRDGASFITGTKREQGQGVANIRVLVATGLPPMRTASNLAWCLGFTWSIRQGLVGQEDIADGFAIWTAHHVVGTLVASPPTPGQWKDLYSMQSDTAKQHFLKLAEIDAQGGPGAVRTYMEQFYRK